ncbi:hypothetical protein ACNKHU_03510 [Shigella flexneri]
MPASANSIVDTVLEDEGTTVTSRRILVACVKATSAGKGTDAPDLKGKRPLRRNASTSGRAKRRCVSPGQSVAWLNTI